MPAAVYRCLGDGVGVGCLVIGLLLSNGASESGICYAWHTAGGAAGEVAAGLVPSGWQPDMSHSACSQPASSGEPS